jgi:hypothetical protein
MDKQTLYNINGVLVFERINMRRELDGFRNGAGHFLKILMFTELVINISILKTIF